MNRHNPLSASAQQQHLGSVPQLALGSTPKTGFNRGQTSRGAPSPLRWHRRDNASDLPNTKPPKQATLEILQSIYANLG